MILLNQIVSHSHDATLLSEVVIIQQAFIACTWRHSQKGNRAYFIAYKCCISANLRNLKPPVIFSF